jgi:hypothetical protein
LIAVALEVTVSREFSFDILPDGSLVLALGEACVQTAAKQAHRELVLAFLEERATGQTLEALVDMLERFLNSTDFASLRAEHPELAGNAPCRVRLYRCEDGIVRWEVLQSK